MMQAAGSLQVPPERDVNYRDLPYSDEVLAAVQRGHKIEAIKILREETGLGLKEAKEAIDALSRERQGKASIAPGMAEEGGAGSMIKLVVVIIAVIVAYFYFFAP